MLELVIQLILVGNWCQFRLLKIFISAFYILIFLLKAYQRQLHVNLLQVGFVIYMWLYLLLFFNIDYEATEEKHDDTFVFLRRLMDLFSEEIMM